MVDLTDTFYNLFNAPRTGIVVLLNEQDKKIFVTYTENSTEILKRLVERFRNLDYTKDLLEDLETKKVQIFVNDIDQDLLNNKDPKGDKEILRYLVSDKLSEYTDSGYTPYQFQYSPIKFKVLVNISSELDYVVSLATARNRLLVIESFKDHQLALDFINKTSILQMIRIYYNN
jgi:hypothetical protein